MRLKPVALSLLALSLAACGGKSSSPSTSGSTTSSDSGSTAVTTGDKQITIIPALGKVLNADVKVSTLDGKRSWTANTGNLGSVNLTMPSDVKSILIEVTGGPTASYFEEGYMKFVPFPAGIKLRAATLVTSVGESFAVTPLTNAAVAYAERLAANNSTHILNDALIVESNDYMAAQFDLTDAYGNHLLTPPALSCAQQLNCTLQVVGSYQDFAGLSTIAVPDKIAARHEILLTSLSLMARAKAGSGEPSPSLKLADELATDLKDGYLDAKTVDDTGTIVAMTAPTTYDYTNVPNLLKLSLVSLLYSDLFYNKPIAGVPDSVGSPKMISQDVFDYMDGYLFTIFGVSNTSDPTVPAQNKGANTSGNPPASSSASILPASNISGGALTGFAGTYTGVASDGKTACTISLSVNDGSITVSEGAVVKTKHYLNGDSNDTQYTRYSNNQKTGQMFVAYDPSDIFGTYAVFWKSTTTTGTGLMLSSAGEIRFDATTSTQTLGYTCTIVNQP